VKQNFKNDANCVLTTKNSRHAQAGRHREHATGSPAFAGLCCRECNQLRLRFGLYGGRRTAKLN